MEDVSKKVQKTSTHIASCVAADGARVKGHVAVADVDAAALYIQRKKRQFNGAMDRATTMFEWHVLT